MRTEAVRTPSQNSNVFKTEEQIMRTMFLLLISIQAFANIPQGNFYKPEEVVNEDIVEDEGLLQISGTTIKSCFSPDGVRKECSEVVFKQRPDGWYEILTHNVLSICEDSEIEETPDNAVYKFYLKGNTLMMKIKSAELGQMNFPLGIKATQNEVSLIESYTECLL